MCGRSLAEGVVFVGISTTVISTVMLISTVGYLISISASDTQYNKHPEVAVNLIFGLVATCLSIYQIVISLLLLWQSFQSRGNIFLCSLWYVSHISLLTLYFLLFSAKAAVCLAKKHYVTAVITMFIGIIYQSIFIYFAIVVNSFLHSLHQERYL